MAVIISLYVSISPLSSAPNLVEILLIVCI
jgi:hypothetical protein